VRFQARYSGETESGRGKNNNSEPKPSIIFKAKDSYLGESNLPECNSAIYATWEREIYLLKKLFIYSHVHTLFGSFLPLATPHLPCPSSLPPRQNLFCTFLQFR
jgi:hypothetical protein